MSEKSLSETNLNKFNSDTRNIIESEHIEVESVNMSVNSGEVLSFKLDKNSSKRTENETTMILQNEINLLQAFLEVQHELNQRIRKFNFDRSHYPCFDGNINK